MSSLRIGCLQPTTSLLRWHVHDYLCHTSGPTRHAKQITDVETIRAYVAVLLQDRQETGALVIRLRTRQVALAHGHLLRAESSMSRPSHAAVPSHRLPHFYNSVVHTKSVIHCATFLQKTAS